METKIKCPICGKEGIIKIITIDGYNGFLDYEPPEKYANFYCAECKLRITSEWTEKLDFPDLDLIKEVQKKLKIQYSQEEIERVGKFCLLHLGSNLRWEEIIHRLKSLQNLIYEK